jgi:hypothetical protein
MSAVEPANTVRSAAARLREAPSARVALDGPPGTRKPRHKGGARRCGRLFRARRVET